MEFGTVKYWIKYGCDGNGGLFRDIKVALTSLAGISEFSRPKVICLAESLSPQCGKFLSKVINIRYYAKVISEPSSG
ncbi:hypothetical protein CEXT_688871 [Caerostris extrusa]|uniref:LAGLIDADG homing endonuclease n=1 Tax=Caerostris extrusa TaxID=172846 RepID=A0AAV4VPR5_CAEEX|nr:hypothetical protein CEXT_688871 [Caerostris extrusa]